MRILLVEDEPDLGAAIKRVLTQQKYLVDWVMDGNEAWGHLEHRWTEYTIGIFDWLLPGISGLELCKKLRQNKNAMPVLMLTAKDSMEDKVAGLDAGADDYLVKPFGMEELLARLRALQRRVPQFQPQKLTMGNLTLDYGNNTIVNQNASSDKQEMSLTNKASAESSSNVVAAQVRLLRRKLAASGCGNPIETLHGMGYRFNFNS